MNNTEQRHAVLDLGPDEFRKLGHQLIDQVADFLGSLPNRPLTTGETPSEIRSLLVQTSLPEEGTDAGQLLTEVATMLFDHSLFNGHPRFWGYITSSAAPIGILAELLAATLPDAPPDLKGLKYADSVALDPHKWLYAPLEAGCALVRDVSILRDTFSYHPSYYKFDEVRGGKRQSHLSIMAPKTRGASGH